MILSDNETKVDLLNNEAIAKTIVSLIKDSKEQPISIGIHGDWGAGKSSILEMVESEVPLNFIDEVELQEAGWYKQKVGDGSATFDKFVIDAIVAVLTSKAPGIKKAAAEAIANYILNNHLQGSYYTKYLNSQVVDKCTQNYYYSYDWYSDPGRTNYIGTTDTGIQTVNLCRR